MYELKKAGEKTYYIDCPAKIGVYRINDTEVCLIDSGNDKSAGKKVLSVLEEHNWQLKMIINTHSHADHIGGNNFLQERTGCEIYCAGVDAAFAQNPILEPSFLYGGYPFENLRNKFLMAQQSQVNILDESNLPEGLEMVSLDGHAFSMSAVKTSDDIWFLADSLTDEDIIAKYHIFYLVDVQKYLDSLDTIMKLKGKLFIPSHTMPMENLEDIVRVNREKIAEIADFLIDFCSQPRQFDDILKGVFDRYNLKMNSNQYVLVGSTIRSYVSYLYDTKKIDIAFEENRMLWEKA
ncbi:MAG: MBL fold metallo-hydrolase [Eubacteriales bacterium]